jgi:hypothetical protein
LKYLTQKLDEKKSMDVKMEEVYDAFIVRPVVLNRWVPQQKF